MSSVTSTDGSPVFRPWHFFVVLTLLAATAAVLTSPKVTPEHLVLLSLTVFAAGAVALAAYRTLLPFAGRERRLLGESLGHRARAALEREKQLVLRSIKELEFDRAMGKLATDDFDEMSRRLRARALGLMQQLDADAMVPRARLERELDERLREDDASSPTLVDVITGPDAIRDAIRGGAAGPVDVGGMACDACGASNDLDARFCKACGTRLTPGRRPSSPSSSAGIATGVMLAILLGLGGSVGVTVAHAQMPDLSQMSGQPLPSGDLPAGTVSVRVVRGALSNNLAGVDVELHGGPKSIVQKTDANGRATFSGLLASQPWRATTTVDGERLTSQDFILPSVGGIRLLLVAGLGSGAGPASGASADGGAGGSSTRPTPPATTAPAVPGTVTIGGQSRIVIELGEQAVEVYGLFDLANASTAPVMPPQPIVFQLPEDARATTVLEGSSPQAKADGARVVVTGPFAPGSTPVQIAYRHPYSGDTLRLAQVLPLRLGQTTVIIRKVGGLQLQLANGLGQREVPLEGRTYLVTNGGALEAGTPLGVTIRGLPHRAVWPRYTALSLAAIVVIGGVLLVLRAAPGDVDDAEIRALRTRRATRFEQLLALERRRTGARPDDQPGLLARRDALMTEIEALDEALGQAFDEPLAPPTPPPASPDAPVVVAAPTTTAAPPPDPSPEQASSDQRSTQLGARPAVR